MHFVLPACSLSQHTHTAKMAEDKPETLAAPETSETSSVSPETSATKVKTRGCRGYRDGRTRPRPKANMHFIAANYTCDCGQVFESRSGLELHALMMQRFQHLRYYTEKGSCNALCIYDPSQFQEQPCVPRLFYHMETGIWCVSWM